MNRGISGLKFVYAFFICQLAGFLGMIFTIQAIPTWYANLIKPSIAPPNWIFGPVWFSLYTLMAISLYIVWAGNSPLKRKALQIFAIQLALNALWTPIFFGLHSPLWGFVTITLLWIYIIFTMFSFYKISKIAAVLLVPYLLWVSFAAVLNFLIWQLNPR